MRRSGSPFRSPFLPVTGVALLMAGCLGGPDGPATTAEPAPNETGTELPLLDGEDLSVFEAVPGYHFGVNLIGVRSHGGGECDTSGASGHVIFVTLDGPTQILLQPGEFRVLDADGTDGVATLQLPAPDEDGDGDPAFALLARALGRPGGSAELTTCLSDSMGTATCSDATAFLERDRGQAAAVDLAPEALFAHVDLGGGTAEDHALFADGGYGAHWTYENSGLKLLQLGFVGTEEPGD